MAWRGRTGLNVAGRGGARGSRASAIGHLPAPLDANDRSSFWTMVTWSLNGRLLIGRGGTGRGGAGRGVEADPNQAEARRGAARSPPTFFRRGEEYFHFSGTTFGWQACPPWRVLHFNLDAGTASARPVNIRSDWGWTLIWTWASSSAGRHVGMGNKINAQPINKKIVHYEKL